ncbi:MAG: hypothetical protein Kow0077_29920 [Anaerolineae bacterium]
MTETARVALMLTVVMGGYLALAALLIGRWLRPPARRVLIGTTLAAIFIIGVHLVTREQHNFWDWLFHPSSELAAGAIYSSAQYVVVVLFMLLIGFYGQWERPWQRLYWIIAALLFGFLCIDEYFSLHESVLLWRYLYPLAGASFVLITLVGWWIGFRKDWRVMALMLFGLALMGFAGVALDSFSNEQVMRFGSYEMNWFVCRTSFLGVPCQSYGFAEEFLEMVGVGLILATAFSFLLERVPGPRLPRIRRVVLAGLGLWVLWAIANVWVIPSVEQLLLAERFPITYEDENLQFLGYTRSTDLAAPGDTVNLTFYFRARRPLTEDYHLSVHVLTREEAESVAQYDLQLGEWKYPSTAWIPGLAVRNRVPLELPADLPNIPQSYLVTARVWSTDRPAKTLEESELDGLTIQESARRLLTPDTVVLFGLPVFAPPEVPPAPQAADFRFDGDYALAGYDLPTDGTVGQPLEVAFWWHTGRNPRIADNYVQFIHLFHENGQDYWVYDRPPFDDLFPTADWPGNLTVVDRFAIPLPADLPPGEYTVRTGMYEPVNKDRIPVRTGDGQVVQDFSITLGQIAITAP